VKGSFVCGVAVFHGQKNGGEGLGGGEREGGRYSYEEKCPLHCILYLPYYELGVLNEKVFSNIFNCMK
jgi:hypothetical protein